MKMSIKNKVKNLKTLGSIALIAIESFLVPVPKAYALDGNIKYVHTKDVANSYVEASAFYKLPGKISGFTFVDFLNGKGYFAKTSLEKNVASVVNAKAQLVHANEPTTQAGVGVSAVIPHMPKNTFAKVSVMPLWFDAYGRVKDKVIVGYFGSVDLPMGFELSSFGEWNIGAEGGPKWAYGEIELGKNIGPVNVSYNPALVGDGDAIPRLEHRVSAKIDF